jgi:hypothetical protein
MFSLDLTNLRVLKVAYNGLKTLDPSTITGHSLQLFHVDFSNNVMETVEFSNTISQQDFCEFNFYSDLRYPETTSKKYFLFRTFRY